MIKIKTWTSAFLAQFACALDHVVDNSDDAIFVYDEENYKLKHFDDLVPNSPGTIDTSTMYSSSSSTSSDEMHSKDSESMETFQSGISSSVKHDERTKEEEIATTIDMYYSEDTSRVITEYLKDDESIQTLIEKRNSKSSSQYERKANESSEQVGIEVPDTEEADSRDDDEPKNTNNIGLIPAQALSDIVDDETNYTLDAETPRYIKLYELGLERQLEKLKERSFEINNDRKRKPDSSGASQKNMLLGDNLRCIYLYNLSVQKQLEGRKRRQHVYKVSAEKANKVHMDFGKISAKNASRLYYEGIKQLIMLDNRRIEAAKYNQRQHKPLCFSHELKVKVQNY